VVDLDFSVYDRTFYLRLHPLDDDTSDESTLTKRLREAKASHYLEHTSEDERNEQGSYAPHHSSVPDESTQMNHLRSAIIQARKERAGRRLLMQLFVAVGIVIIIGLMVVGWFNA
jgi:hypothetical protein